MRKLGFFLVCLMLSTCPMAAQEVLAIFNRSNYEGWTYLNNSGVQLDAQNIGRGRITLLTTVQGNVTELISPALDCAGVDSLKVQVTYRLEDGYAVGKVSLLVSLCDPEGELENSELLKVPAKVSECELTTTMAVPAGAQHVLHFTAPDADKDNCGAVMEVKVLAVSSTVPGDLDGDGKVDVSDVNALINIILKNSAESDYSGKADVDGDGKVDVSDVNAVINIILKI